MGRASHRLCVVALVAVASAGAARADFVDDEGRELSTARHYKRRLAAALTLSKFHDGRAVRSLTTALERDGEAQLRQVAALALGKAVTADTPATERDAALAALERAQKGDVDAKVRELAGLTLTKLGPLRPASPAAAPPAIFIYVTAATDGSRVAPADAPGKLTHLVKGVVARRAPELPTQWPGALPTGKELVTRGTRAFSVAATIAKVDIVRRGSQSEITCTVRVQVTPWNGVDGSERWVAHKAASATGQGKASTASTQRATDGGIRDCVMAVAEELTANKVVPFLRKVVTSS